MEVLYLFLVVREILRSRISSNFVFPFVSIVCCLPQGYFTCFVVSFDLYK